jgi:hypothetical protein
MTDYGSKQAEIVMRTFYRHKLRDPGGHTITDVKRAKAVAHQEEEAAKERGTEIRTFKGRTRRRPKLKK